MHFEFFTGYTFYEFINTGTVMRTYDFLNFFLHSSYSALFVLICFLPPSSASELEIVPQRIISLGPIITQTIYLLGADQQLIANTTYCTVPLDAQQKEKIGTVKQMNIEKVVRLRPDLILANALSSQKQINTLRKFGIRIIRFENPKTFSEMCRMTLELGKLVGRKQQAEQIIQKTQKDFSYIFSKTRYLPKKRVFFQIGIKPLHMAVGETFINEYIEYSGGTNIAMHERAGAYSREKVLQKNPDVILIATMGSSKTAGKTEKENWMKFQSMNAVKNNEIHVLDPDIICSPTPVTFIKALKVVVKKVHPEISL
jgi:iron complex transport system substrate-binding protein